MTDRPIAYVVHAMPGRVRVRVPDRKGDTAFLDSIASRLAEIPSVTSVAANPVTGSVLMHFTGDIQALAMRAMMLLDRVQLELSPPPARPVLERVRDELAGFDATMRELTGGEMDARAMAFAGILLLSAVQLFRGNVLSPAATMLWYAADLARQWRSPDETNRSSG